MERGKRRRVTVFSWACAWCRALATLLLGPMMSVFFSMCAPLMWLMGVCTDILLWFFIGKSFIYNISWEDPQIDQRVLRLSSDDEVITLCSAGDNALDYVLEGARVTAVDLNPCQIALAELKKVAAMHLCHEDLFSIFARNDVKLLKEKYQTVLRTNMTPLAAKFWDRYVHRIRNFLYAGTSGFAAYLLFRLLFPLCGLGWMRRVIMSGASVEEFHNEVKKHSYQLDMMMYFLDNYIFKAFSAFAGVPRAQFKLGAHRSGNARKIFNTAFVDSDIVKDNYFFYGYLVGQWSTDCCPRYLKKEHFEQLQTNLRNGCLTLVHSTLDKHLASCEDGQFTVASLLDHLDWMDAAQVNIELSTLIPKLNQKTGRLFWRSFADELHSGPLIWLNPSRVDDTGDRVGMYFSTWTANVGDTEFTLPRRCYRAQFYNQGTLQNLVTGVRMVAFPIKEACSAWSLNGRKTGGQNKQHERTIESFYRLQKYGYDSFREQMLHGRPVLMNILPILKKGGIVWVDIGGGTARNLEFFTPSIICKYFKEVYIVDISQSLLEVARNRVASMGVSDIVKLVHGDCTSSAIWADLPPPETVDIVTMSYSLSMIPDKPTAIANALKLLKPRGKGVLGICDFFMFAGREDSLPQHKTILRTMESATHKWWFAHDHVQLLGPDIEQILTNSSDLIWDQRFRGSIPFLPAFRPVHGAMLLKSR